MSRRSLLRRKKLGYDPMPLRLTADKRGAWKLSQAGGIAAKLEPQPRKTWKRNHKWPRVGTP